MREVYHYNNYLVTLTGSGNNVKMLVVKVSYYNKKLSKFSFVMVTATRCHSLGVKAQNSGGAVSVFIS